MDKSEIKLLLESYRPQDAADPIFAEALRAVVADPELAEWFEDMQQFDAVMVGKLRDVVAPPDVKSHIMLGYRTSPPAHPRPPRVWRMLGSIAALLLVSLFVWRHFAPPPPRTQALANQAISFTGKMPALQFVCFDATVVARWINAQPGTQMVGLKIPKQDKSMSMAMIGSSVVDWSGHPVVMICLQNGKRMAMLYILKADVAADLPEGATETVQKADWVVRTTKTEGQVRVLTAKGRPEDLNFPIPL